MPNSYLEWTCENGQVRHLEVVDKVFVGRGCRGIEESKRIIVKDPRVSRDHAIISTSGLHLQNFKGTIKDYVGDAVYTFWDHGVQQRKEQALLACRAALKQLQALDQMRSSLSSGRHPDAEGLPMGWGITTGRVTMAHYSSRAADLALVGGATNLAFRLSGMANKDLSSLIAMCSQTADLVQDTLLPVDLGFFVVRGRAGQEHLYGIK